MCLETTHLIRGIVVLKQHEQAFENPGPFDTPRRGYADHRSAEEPARMREILAADGTFD